MRGGGLLIFFKKKKLWRRYQKGNKFIKLHLVPSRSFHNKPPNSVKAKYCCKGIGVIQKRLETLQNLLNSVDIAHYSRENSVKLFILCYVSRGRIQKKMKQGAIYQVRKLVGRVLHNKRLSFLLRFPNKTQNHTLFSFMPSRQ